MQNLVVTSIVKKDNNQLISINRNARPNNNQLITYNQPVRYLLKIQQTPVNNTYNNSICYFLSAWVRTGSNKLFKNFASTLQICIKNKIKTMF